MADTAKSNNEVSLRPVENQSGMAGVMRAGEVAGGTLWPPQRLHEQPSRPGTENDANQTGVVANLRIRKGEKIV